MGLSSTRRRRLTLRLLRKLVHRPMTRRTGLSSLTRMMPGLLDRIQLCLSIRPCQRTLQLTSPGLPLLLTLIQDPGCSASNDEHGILQRGRMALQPSGGQEWRHWESSGHPPASQEVNLTLWATGTSINCFTEPYNEYIHRCTSSQCI